MYFMYITITNSINILLMQVFVINTIGKVLITKNFAFIEFFSIESKISPMYKFINSANVFNKIFSSSSFL